MLEPTRTNGLNVYFHDGIVVKINIKEDQKMKKYICNQLKKILTNGARQGLGRDKRRYP